jgi:AcrR family transcriptional regulator
VARSKIVTVSLGRVSTEEGARAQRKRRTRQTIVDVATGLFLARGFDQVSVADIAAQSHVSKMTVFNYFDTKEDILLSQLAEYIDVAADVVRGRPAGVSPLTALRRHFIAGLREHAPVTGLCDQPEVIEFRALIVSTRSLVTRLIEQAVQAEESLSAALRELPGADPLDASVVAAQLIGAQRALVTSNFDRIQAGGDLAELTTAAIADAERAYGLLADGLGRDLFGRDDAPDPASPRN